MSPPSGGPRRCDSVEARSQVCGVLEFTGLHLGEAAIHKQFRSRDVAAVVGCEKYHSLRDLIGCAEPAEWNDAGNGLHVFLGRFCGMPRACRYSLGSPRSRECGDPLSPLSMSARTNAPRLWWRYKHSTRP